MQPDVGLHESFVHGLPSLQGAAEPVQLPPWHVSLTVHGLPSEQLAPSVTLDSNEQTWVLYDVLTHRFLRHCVSLLLGQNGTEPGFRTHCLSTQYKNPLHASLSLGPMHSASLPPGQPQLAGPTPGLQTPAEQKSPSVHALPSLQEPAASVSGWNWQSAVTWQVSLVQSFLSLHLEWTTVCVTVFVASLHVSVVQLTPSLICSGELTQPTPATHVSVPVQYLPSSHTV